MKNVLVACEESQRVCKAFLERGFNAYSCDIQKPSGNRPDRHILGDVIPLLNGECSFTTMDGTRHLFPHKWDLIIAHPPCTYLSAVKLLGIGLTKGEKKGKKTELRPFKA